mmetsp:Transcript_46996/g.150746  ORF Transcript_46996/g.150746 Transcript_46996/m.150746 type:complete len:116 (-) Transcript_46996:42-389(-)
MNVSPLPSPGSVAFGFGDAFDGTQPLGDGRREDVRSNPVSLDVRLMPSASLGLLPARGMVKRFGRDLLFMRASSCCFSRAGGRGPKLMLANDVVRSSAVHKKAAPRARALKPAVT